MQRRGTPNNAVERLPRRKADQFNKVFDDHKERARGLWERKGVFYAQLDANNGKQYKYPLQHAATVPQALTEMQALKKIQREGKLYPPGITAEEAEKEYTEESADGSHTIKEAIQGYQSDRNQLKTKDPATCVREDSGLKKWVLGFGDCLLTSVDAKAYKDYAIFCKTSAAEKLSTKSFRADDIKDLPGLAEKLTDKSDLMSAWLQEQMDKRIQNLLVKVQQRRECEASLRPALARRLNRIAKGDSIFEETRFTGVTLRPDTQHLLEQKPEGRQLFQLNRLLLEDRFSTNIMRAPTEASCSGRNIDLGILAMNHVLDWAIVEHWLPDDFRKPVWKSMATEPAKDRLMEPEEIDQLCDAAMLDAEALDMIDPRVRHLRKAQSITGQNFQDYLRLLQWTGGREQETLRQRWSNVHWGKGERPGYLHFPGEEAKAGGGEPAEPRDVTFSDQLEALLKRMFKRRDPESDWMFPSDRHDGPISSFRSQLERVKKQTKLVDVTFQFFRHWFISHCVLANIDYKTIAYWVSHRDGGGSIGRLYGHLDKTHPAKMAKKLSFHFS